MPDVTALDLPYLPMDEASFADARAKKDKF